MKHLRNFLKVNRPKQIQFISGLLVAVLGVTGLFFQNCSQNFQTQQSFYQLSVEHPSISDSVVSPEPPPVATTKLVIGDQRFLESALREAFLTSESPPNETGFMDYVFNEEFNREQHLLGRGCDPIEYGNGNLCFTSLGNANLGMSVSTSSGREAARLQICRRTISNDVMMARAIGKVKGSSSALNEASIEGVVRLWYPNMDQNVVDATVAKLSEMNQAMIAGQESELNRWKLLFLTVCESAGWEAL